MYSSSCTHNNPFVGFKDLNNQQQPEKMQCNHRAEVRTGIYTIYPLDRARSVTTIMMMIFGVALYSWCAKSHEHVGILGIFRY